MRKSFLQKSEGVVFQEVKDSFNETPLVTRNCVKAINSLVHFLSTHKMSRDTINNILLFLLRSFQSDEAYLKRIIYSCIVELSKHTDQGFVSINILVRDLNSKIDDKKKTEVLKALFSVVPKEMVYDFEKYVTQALVSGDDYRADAAVVISYLLLSKNFGKVKGWITNLDIPNDIFGYHKLGLLSKGNLLSRYEKVWGCRDTPAILSVRILAEMLTSSSITYFRNFLNVSLSTEAVFFEACKRVVKMKDEMAIQFISQALQGLRVFIKSPTFSYKFASIRIVSLLSLRFPKAVSSLNGEIEDLLSEDSKTISMLAISTLLKTGTEETVDRLVQRLPEFMNEMDDNYKKISIDTLESLTTLYQSKANVFVNFLAKSMQERGALEFKMYLLTVFSRNIKKDFLREKILDILCMYIEDSEHHLLSMEILGMMGREIPNTPNPRKYLLHVYNRLILEDNKIRSAALQCLYTLSLSLDTSVGLSTIKGCVNDPDKMVSGFSKFFLESLNVSSVGYDFEDVCNELGDLKDDVLGLLGLQEDELVENKVESISLKACREIQLSQESSDIRITLVKKIVESRRILEFSLENLLEDVQVLSGKMSLQVGTELLRLDVPTILPKQTHSFETEIEVEINEVVNGVFDYELCIEEDLSETENESTTLVPFMFTIFDLSTHCDVLSRPSGSASVNFILNKDLTNSSKKILDLLNLKILSQELSSNHLVMSLSGNYSGDDILVDLDISFSRVSKCSLNIYCDNPELLNSLIGYFD